MSMSIRLLSLMFVCSLLLVNLAHYGALNQSSLPAFLEEGSFAQYKQEFSSGETHELRWEIASFVGSSFEISIRSHGLVFNTTTKTYDITLGGGTMIVDKDSLEILNAYCPNGTEMSGYPVGERIAFWISDTVNETSLINSMYETDRHPTLVGPLEFDCLTSTRMCWMTENVYSSGNWMNRYYDRETGIILRIETHLRVDTVETSILETLNSTNIVPLIEATADMDSALVVYALFTGLSLSGLVALVFYHRRRKQ